MPPTQSKERNSIVTLHRSNIDKHRWDNLVLSAGGPLYATFDYLTCCGEWEATVFEKDQQYYHAVPIPYRERGGIRYVYQSPFACFLTILSRRRDDETFEFFRSAWFTHLRTYNYLAKYFFCDSSFEDLKGCQIVHLGGLKIDLTQDYETILKGYSHNRGYDVKKHAEELIVSLSDNLDLFFKWNAALPIKSFLPSQLAELRMLWEKLLSNRQIEIYFATVDGEVISGNLIGKFGASLYSLAAFSTSEGRRKNALTIITDHILKKYAKSNYSTFDFGSLTGTGIDDFKSSFGAKRYSIYQIYRNELPWYIKIPKSILNYFKVSVS